MIERKDLLDGFSFLAFALLLTSLTSTISPNNYLGFISPFVMFFFLALGAVFSFCCGAYILVEGFFKGF